MSISPVRMRAGRARNVGAIQSRVREAMGITDEQNTDQGDLLERLLILLCLQVRCRPAPQQYPNSSMLATERRQESVLGEVFATSCTALAQCSVSME